MMTENGAEQFDVCWVPGQIVTCITKPCGIALARMFPLLSVLVVTTVGLTGSVLMTWMRWLLKVIVPFLNGLPSAFTTCPLTEHMAGPTGVGVGEGVAVAVGVGDCDGNGVPVGVAVGVACAPATPTHTNSKSPMPKKRFNAWWPQISAGPIS